MQNSNRKVYWRRPRGWLLLIVGWPIIAVGLALVGGTPTSSQAASNTIYILTNGNDTNCDGTANTPYNGTPGGCAKQTVQAGVGVVATGGTVFIGSGVFTEQVVITRPMILSGAGRNSTTVRAPEQPARVYTSTSNEAFKPVITAHDTSNVTIQQLEVDGAGRGNYDQGTFFVGIGYYSASGTVSNTTITGVRRTPFDGLQDGFALDVRNYATNISQTFLANNNVITDYQKNGVLFNGEGLVVTATNNVITGAGLNDIIAQNGIQLSYGANGYIANNTITGNFYTGDPLYDASGIAFFKSGPNAEIANNTFIGNGAQVLLYAASSYKVHDNFISGVVTTTHNSFGVQVDQDGVNSSGTIIHNQIIGHNFGLAGGDLSKNSIVSNVVVSYNRIANNTTAGIDTTGPPIGASTPISMTANNNWWGCNAGPNQPGCDTTNGSVVTANWLTLRLSATPTTIVTGGSATVTATLTDNQANQPSGGFVANGTPVVFTATAGTLSPGIVSTTNGIATATYTGPANPYNDLIGAKVDNQLVTTTIAVICNTATVSESGDGNVCGTLRYAVSHPPANKTININTTSPIQLNDRLIITGPLTLAGSSCLLPAIIMPDNTFPPATNGLEVSGGVRLQNIKVQGFPGVEIKTATGDNVFKCVTTTDTP